jgi:hypothetical protein
MKFGIGVLYKQMSGKIEVQENRTSYSHTALTGEQIPIHTFQYSVIVLCQILLMSSFDAITQKVTFEKIG